MSPINDRSRPVIGEEMKKKIYLASSWRNLYQPTVLTDLRAAGHEVYDFRHPTPDDNGFSWKSIDPEWNKWTPAQLREALKHPLAVHGHNLDHSAMEWANACVLLLPSGNSAHLEAGWCAGRGKPTAVYAPEIRDADLMYKSFEMVSASLGNPPFCVEFSEVLDFLDKSANLL
jgi:hypothetical protein